MVHPLMIIGSGGFVGSHFCRAYPEALALSRHDLDLAHPTLKVSTAGVKWAVIAAGVGNPRKCEADPQASYQCNVTGTLTLGKELLKRGILPILFSTDYVLDDTLNIAPKNQYGLQKAELEEEGAKMGALIIRLSKVYGTEKGDGTLFDEMVSQLKMGKRVRAARDQIFSPIYVGDVVKQTMHLVCTGVKGVVTVAGPSYDSRVEMARWAVARLGIDSGLVEEISLDDLQDGVCRPKRLALKGNFSALAWQDGLEQVVKAYA